MVKIDEIDWRGHKLLHGGADARDQETHHDDWSPVPRKLNR